MDTLTRTAGDSGYLSLLQVLELVPVSRSTIYGWVAHGHFPPPRKIGPRRVGWRRDEVVAWLISREKAQRGRQS